MDFSKNQLILLNEIPNDSEIIITIKDYQNNYVRICFINNTIILVLHKDHIIIQYSKTKYYNILLQIH